MWLEIVLRGTLEEIEALGSVMVVVHVTVSVTTIETISVTFEAVSVM